MSAAMKLPVAHADDDLRGLIASPERLRAWVEVAKKGDRFVYATRSFLPTNSVGAGFARLLQSLGLVDLIRKRSDLLAGEWNYIVERRSKSLKDAFGHANHREQLAIARTHPADGEAAGIDRLLPVLSRAAQFGRPCPTDKKLAEMAQVAVHDVQNLMNAMRAANLIRVHAAAAPTLRRVLIVATGFQTGLVA